MRRSWPWLVLVAAARTPALALALPVGRGPARPRRAARQGARLSELGAPASSHLLGENRGHGGTMALGATEQRRIELGALVEPVHVGLPSESDPAVGLD